MYQQPQEIPLEFSNGTSTPSTPEERELKKINDGILEIVSMCNNLNRKKPTISKPTNKQRFFEFGEALFIDEMDWLDETQKNALADSVMSTILKELHKLEPTTDQDKERVRIAIRTLVRINKKKVA